jgi:hypothetical protein
MMAINTPTIKDYVEVVGWAINNNITWNSESRSICERYWESSETCILIRGTIMTFCRRIYAIEHFLIKILDMEQFHIFVGKSHFNNFKKKYDLR